MELGEVMCVGNSKEKREGIPLNQLTDKHLMNCLGYVRIMNKRRILSGIDYEIKAEDALIHEFNFRLKIYLESNVQNSL